MTGDEDLIDNMLSDSVEQAIYTYHLFIVFEVPRSLSFISDQGQGNSQQEVQKQGERGVILKLSDNMVSFCFHISSFNTPHTYCLLNAILGSRRDMR